MPGLCVALDCVFVIAPDAASFLLSTHILVARRRQRAPPMAFLLVVFPMGLLDPNQ